MKLAQSLTAACIALFIAAHLLAQDRRAPAPRPPAAPPPAPAEYVVGPMHVQTLPPITYLYGTARTTFADIDQPVNRFLPALQKSADDGQIKLAGPPLFIYHDVREPNQPFTLDVGFPVAPDTRPPAQFQLRQTREFRCATRLFTGPMSRIDRAYEKLGPGVTAAGYAPTGETRELYLYWEKPESPNNVIQLQMGIR